MTQIKKLKLATEGIESAEERIKIKLSGLCDLGGEEANMEMKKSTRYEMRDTRYENGSALILAVVLTSLLAIVGVMFVMVARVDRIATSGISENKTLDSAVEAVIARISQELVLDVPGVGGQPDYYDYPDAKNAWLASLEPHKDGGYKWRQISDVTGYIEKVIPDVKGSWHTQDIEITNNPVNENFKAVIADCKKIELDNNGHLEEQLADADGDGVADSKWIELDDITSNKGKPIYAAIRVIDDGGMLNVNTAYQFNPNSSVKNEIDGSSQTQIDLFALSERGASNFITDLDDMRRGSEIWDLDDYIRDVVWRYNEPNGAYTPFDISDELELRYRFMLNEEDIDARIETVWKNAFRGDHYLYCPIGSTEKTVDDWFDRAQYDLSDPNADEYYSYRHIGTTYNMDRIINPYGGKMVNVNKAGAGSIYNAIKLALFTADPNFKDIDEIAAQTAVNLIDFRDNDSDVTPLPDVNGNPYYGFERPCVYISELAHKFTEPNIPPGLPVPASLINRSYAIELHKPYTEDDYPDVNQWQLRLEGHGTFPVDWSGTRHFHVMLFEHPGAALEPKVSFNLADKDPNFTPSAEKTESLKPGTIVFAPGKTVSLERRVGADWISVDSVTVQYGPGPPYKVWNIDDKVHSYQRDITLHKCIRRLWDDSFDYELSETLGQRNGYTDAATEMIQAHPENRPFTNIGEIGMVFRKGAYYQNDIDRPDRIGYGLNKDEEQVRLDLADPNYQQIFNYLTVFDPTRDGINNDGDDWTNEDALNQTPEWKIPGRININTAPWFVIAQLPWMTDKIAQAIVAYRDKLKTPVDYSDPNAGNTGRYDVIKNKIPSWVDQDDIREDLGFASIGELVFVLSGGKDEYNEYSIDRLSKDSNDLEDFPDLTPNDDAADDFEERDVIFARLSNLVTVRSDVFTAYILVRIGADGPQRRVMAILDRSNVYSDDDRVQIVALHPVADPR